jgi:outer membrane protein OmpA-like peptidoglycan-associated protein
MMSEFLKRVLVYIFILTSTISYSQRDRYSNSNEDYNTWAIGAGFSLLSLQGDLRSSDTKSGDAYYNMGGFIYVDKMFNPIIGIEAKFNISKLGGELQTLSTTAEPGESSYYRVLYAEAYQNELLKVEGMSFGFETNLILNMDNLWKRHSQKWSWTGYVGFGYQKYNSRLIIKDYDASLGKYPLDDVDEDGTIRNADFGENSNRDFNKNAGSLYLNAALSVKYRLNGKFDIEARGVINLNNEDHLDAAITHKQTYESFFTANIGVVYKFGNKERYAIWVQEEEPEPFVLIDTDDDGVQDDMDKEINTPRGAEVYGSGIAIDTDKDGIKDYEDDCPIVPGPVSNNGCPVQSAVVYNEPITETVLELEPEIEFDEDDKQDLIDRITMFSRAIYFKTNSDQLKQESYKPLNQIAEVMTEYPDSRFKIEGHTDSKGNDNYNLSLSEKRSKSVHSNLTEKYISSVRLSSKGYGEVQPIATNDTESGRQKNRRVEINFIDPDSEEGKLVYPQETVLIRSNNSSKTLSYSGGNQAARDSDGDGVTDIYDKEPNTSKESRVYGDGVSVDSDMDGVPDYLDSCPFAKGSIEEKGCPLNNQSNAYSIPTNIKVGDVSSDQDQVRSNKVNSIVSYSGNIEYDLKVLASKIKFSRSEGHVLKSNNIFILEKIGKLLNQRNDISVHIEVHTNNKPNLKYNLDLSKRRAFAMKKYLTQVIDIDSSRLEVNGVGGVNPKYNVENKQENTKNNRVEIDIN